MSRLALGNARPFFLVGSDALSQRWLIARREELLRLGAVGMLIQAETEADVRRIAALAQRPVHNTRFGHGYRQSAGY